MWGRGGSRIYRGRRAVLRGRRMGMGMESVIWSGCREIWEGEGEGEEPEGWQGEEWQGEGGEEDWGE
jgi:hypothetical protein